MSECSFINGRCVVCGHVLPAKFGDDVHKICTGPLCPHLGPPIEREGVTVKIKCGCNGKEHDHPHTAHECGLYNRCLPTLRPADLAAWLERKPESDIYHLCHGCDRGANQEQ